MEKSMSLLDFLIFEVVQKVECYNLFMQVFFYFKQSVKQLKYI